jgi:hypothetical protein
LTDGKERFKVGEFELKLADFGAAAIQESHVTPLRDRYDDEDSEQAERRHLRAGVRVNSKVKLAVERKENGGVARAEGHTMDVSTYSCMAVVPEGFEVGEELRLINLINQKECEAVLVWRGQRGLRGGKLECSCVRRSRIFGSWIFRGCRERIGARQLQGWQRFPPIILWSIVTFRLPLYGLGT